MLPLDNKIEELLKLTMSEQEITLLKLDLLLWTNDNWKLLRLMECIRDSYHAGYADGCWDTTIRYDLSTEDPVLERLARQALKDYKK